ncbi:MAG: DUF4037 domain-containing protein [Spirochaetaceae bacterium]|nr:DUF4037 domain-containing protein [Spirochaetaceae bacterium]
MKAKFIPGLELSKKYFIQAVKPILEQSFPHLSYSAGLVDYGSDVLRCDTVISMDHQWGPRLSIFLSKKDMVNLGTSIHDKLCDKLPPQFMGYSTHFSTAGPDGIRWMEPWKEGPVNHLVLIQNWEEFLGWHLNWSPEASINPTQWLLFPQQRLLTLRSGKIWQDGLSLQITIDQLHYYPEDIWRYIMAQQWSLIGQEEAFLGRCGQEGDELGSSLVAGRLVQHLMYLCFHMEKEYAPYSKWLGTAFSKLSCASDLYPILEKINHAKKWQKRESFLVKAYRVVLKRFNRLGIIDPLDTEARDYYGRPYRVVFGSEIAGKIKQSIKAPEVRSLPSLGNIDQITQSSALLEHNHRINKMAYLYE